MFRPTRIPLPALAFLLAGTASGTVKILGYWWENPLPYQEVPRGLKSLRAADCGVCHQEIYREWQASTHARALTDRQFQAEMQKSPSAAWLCLNCHTPLENQLARIAIGVRNHSTHQPILRDNARYDAALAREGVTCAVCHVKDGAILGPWGAPGAPHPVRKAPALLTAEACASCHQATAAYTDTLVCTFDTAGEWRRSPYAARGEGCTHCHMPAVTRPAAAGGPMRESRRHLFPGSKIPKEMNLPAGHRALYDLFASGLTVEVRAGRLILRNARAGHLLPTGDPERFILVRAELLDAAGALVERLVHRIGQEWEWHPKARKLSDNRLQPLEQRVLPLPQAPRARRVRVTVENWRLSDQNAEYHKLRGVYPQSAVVLQMERRLR